MNAKQFINKIILQEMKSLKENQARITHGSEEIHKLNDQPIKSFASQYSGDPVDIFFTNSGTAHVTKRTTNLISHGKDSGKSLNLKDVKIIYSGLGDEFYKPTEFGAYLKSVYMGSKSRVRPTQPD